VSRTGSRNLKADCRGALMFGRCFMFQMFQGARVSACNGWGHKISTDSDALGETNETRNTRPRPRRDSVALTDPANARARRGQAGVHLQMMRSPSQWPASPRLSMVSGRSWIDARSLMASRGSGATGTTALVAPRQITPQGLGGFRREVQPRRQH
jgi:hypothetical protein